MAKLNYITLIFTGKSYGELRRATESYILVSRDIEINGIKMFTKFISDQPRAMESYGELQRATKSYGYLWIKKFI